MKFFLHNRHLRDRSTTLIMIGAAILVLSMPVLLGLGLSVKSSPLINEVGLSDLLTNSDWKPMQGKFGFLPFIWSSFLVTLIAIIIAAPLCIFSAIYLTQFASKKLLTWMHPVIDILAGIPSVVYGVWGILVIVPLVSKLGDLFGSPNGGYTILAGAIVLAVMIIPFIMNITIEVFRTIPDELSEASLSLGATHWETVKYVLVKKAFPGILSAIGLGVSRAFGETIAVLMVVGNVTTIPTSVFEGGYPLPALIANNYGEMLSIPQYDSALMFAALLLFIIVLVFNLLSRLAIIRIENKQ